MGMFELQGDDGATYEVDAPDAARAVAAFKKLQARNAPPPDPNAGQRPLGLEPDTPAYPRMTRQEAGDIIPSFGSGVVRGTTGLVGLPADLATIFGRGANKAANTFIPDSGQGPGDYGIAPDWVSMGGSRNLQKLTEDYVTGPMHQSTTTGGKYAETFGEFAPGGIIGRVANIPRNLVKNALLPSFASEAAGQATAGTPLEGPARVIAGVGTGVGAAVATAPSAVERSLGRAVRGATPEQITAAENLIQQGRALDQPINLSWGEAINAVTNGATDIGSLQRYVEGAGGMRDFYANRPQQVDAAGRQMFNDITPPNPNPSNVGPAVSEAGQQTILDAERARTAATDPFYNAARTDTVPAPRMGAFLDNLDNIAASDKTGIVGQKVSELKNLLTEAPAVAGTPASRTPVLGPNGQVIRYDTTPAVPGTPRTPITDIENLDRARKHVRDQIGAPQIGADAITKEQASTVSGQLGKLRDEMTAASPNFAAGKAEHARITEEIIKPLMNGPVGKVAERPETKAAIEALFPARPNANSEQEIARAMTELAIRNKPAATDLLRVHMENTFNEASRLLQSGAPQYAGAGFVKALVGNPQQMANLKAGFTAVRGAQTWEGVQRYLDVMAATGQRQRPGSPTTFNSAFEKGLEQGNLIGEAAKAAATGGFKLPSRINDVLNRWSAGRNVDELSRLLTDPGAAALFRRLASTNNGAERTFLIGRLTNMGMRGSDAPSRNEITVTPSRPR